MHDSFLTPFKGDDHQVGIAGSAGTEPVIKYDGQITDAIGDFVLAKVQEKDNYGGAGVCLAIAMAESRVAPKVNFGCVLGIDNQAKELCEFLEGNFPISISA